MDLDVIELGKPGREPRPPRARRRGWPFGVAALLALAAVAYTGTRPDQAPRPVASASPSPYVAPTPVVISIEPDVPPDVPDPTFAGRWEGTAPGERTGLLLASNSRTEVVVQDADTGRERVLSPPDLGGYAQVVAQIDGGWLVGAFPFCEEICNGRFYALRGRDATLVGTGTRAFLDPDGGSVWVSGMARQSYDSPEYLEHRTFAGARIAARMTLRRGESVLGITPSGPLLYGGYDDTPVLVDFPAQRRTRVLAGRFPIAVSGYEVATIDSFCYGPHNQPCRLRVTNLRTGRSRRVATVDVVVERGAMDPAARYVAFRVENDTRAVRVYDVAAGREVAIGGIGSPPAATSVGWSPDGRWLVFAHPTAEDGENPVGGTQVAVWRPGLARPYLVKDLPRRDFGDLVVGRAR